MDVYLFGFLVGFSPTSCNMTSSGLWCVYHVLIQGSIIHVLPSFGVFTILFKILSIQVILSFLVAECWVGWLWKP